MSTLEPEAGQVLLQATCTLLELDPDERALASIAEVREPGAGVELQTGARVTVRRQGTSTTFVARARHCFGLADSVSEGPALVLPVLAEVLYALRQGDPLVGHGGRRDHGP